MVVADAGYDSDAHGLKPHLIRGFKLSNEKQFVEKLNDIVGRYLNAPVGTWQRHDEGRRMLPLNRIMPIMS